MDLKTYYSRPFFWYTTSLPYSFEFVYLMTPLHLGSQKYSSRPLIWYMICLPSKIFGILHLMTPVPPHGHQKYKNKPTRQDLSYDICHAYFLRTLDFCTWRPHPTPSHGFVNMNSETYSSRPFIWYTTRLPQRSLKCCTWWLPPLHFQYEIWNLLKTFHMICYMTTFPKLRFFFLSFFLIHLI